MAAANQGAKAGEQFFQLERLGQVVVGAEVEAANLVVDGAEGGQHQHMGLEAVAPPVLQESEAVNLGQHQVEDDGVVLGGAGLEIALLAVVGHIDGETLFLQTLAEDAGERLVVFDEQHTHSEVSVADRGEVEGRGRERGAAKSTSRDPRGVS